MSDNVVKIRPNRLYTLDELYAEAKAKGVVKCAIVGIQEDGETYCNATNDCLLSELTWLAMTFLGAVQHWMTK